MIKSMKGEINSNTIIVGDFNTPLIPMNRSIKQKISKGTQALNEKNGPVRPNWYLQGISPQNNGFQLFPKVHKEHSPGCIT